MAVLFLILLGVGVAAARALVHSSAVREERRYAEERVQSLTLKKEALLQEVQDFDTGPGIEREARDKLNLRKPGEEVVIIIDNTSSTASATDEENRRGALGRLFDRLRASIGIGNQ